MKAPALALLVIDDDDVDRKIIARAFKALGTGYDIREASDGRSGLELACSQPFDCILLDYNLPDTNGLALLVELRKRSGVSTPVVILTGTGNESLAVEAMKLGAHDYLSKAQMGPNVLSRAIANAIEKNALQLKLLDAQEKLERLALYDPLTGLGNRNLFHYDLTRAIAVSRRQGSTFPLLMMDLDRFKGTNDTFGHEAGDEILAAVGGRLRAMSRLADTYFRLGGDEFTGILHAGSDGQEAARRIVAAIAKPFQFQQHSLEIGVSIGVANYPADGQDSEQLARAADAAMYKAKGSRRRWRAVTGSIEA